VGSDRGKMSSFPDPAELSELDGSWGEHDPSIHERTTAVPGEIPNTPPDGVGGGDDEPISGLQQWQTPDGAMPSFREPLPDEDLPPVLAPAASSRSRSKSATPAEAAKSAPPDTTWKSTGKRKSLPTKRPVLELELDDIPSERPPPEQKPDALEAPLQMRSGQPPASLPRVPEASREVLDMRDRYRAGDFTGALVVAEALLEADPSHDEARRCHQLCTDVLSQMYLARLGSPTQVVRMAVPADQIRWLSLDHRAGFLLSLVDGMSTIEELLDISGMPRLDALRILYGLLDQRAIALSER
jgi:hypothetical protein